MTILKNTAIDVIKSTKIKATFSLNLSPFINTSNVEISSNLATIPNPQVIKVVVKNNTLIITTTPLFPYASYFITFKNSSISTFKSKNNEATLIEDGKNNIVLFLGAEEPENKIRDNLIWELKDDVYNLQSKTLVRDILNAIGKEWSKAFNDIRQVKNENYLEKSVVNERKIRGAGPTDRLDEEGAFEVIKVSKNLNGEILNNSINISEFPSYPITLQSIPVNNEILVPGTSIGTFNGLFLNLRKNNVIKLKSVVINYSDGSSYNYNISIYGYQVLNDRYDPDFASILNTLDSNQILLSSEVLSDENFRQPVTGDRIVVSYEYKSPGRIVESDSVEIYQIEDVIRETTPPIINSFTLQKYPIVDSLGNILEIDGVSFLDPEANPPFSESHPAFIKELKFNLDGLPKAPGEYCVNYTTGDVFVYGETINDGTGAFPPAATYKYKKSFVNELDYIYDSDTYEVVRSPLRNLEGESVILSYDYQSTLVDGVDFISKVHNEVLNERVENRVTSTTSLQVKNGPITNVFRIYNETTGEIYPLDRFNENNIYFSATNPPRVINVIKERASFSDVTNEFLIVSEELINSSNIRIFKINLNNERIIGSSEDVIGSSFNTSVSFSNTNLFSIELYLDLINLTLEDNLNRLDINQYLVNYTDGIIYLAVENDQSYDLGTVNYKKSTIKTSNSHIHSVSQLYYSLLPNSVDQQLSYIEFDDLEITPTSLDNSDERFLAGDETDPYIVDTNTITVTDDIKEIRGIYDSYDLNNNIILTNFAETATFSNNIITVNPINKQQNNTISSGLTVVVDYISPGVEIESVQSVRRLSDNAELYDNSGSFSGYTITLSGINSPIVGEEVEVIYSVKLNGNAGPVVDYNRGDLYVDYDYIADEILVSYEYGDNVLDFSESTTVDTGTEYYVTYKVGALRDTLLPNFGKTLNIPILNNFDTNIEREKYRDALQGAFQTYPRGPTKGSLQDLVEAITHIKPEIIEAAFEGWSLGTSRLYLKQVNTTGILDLMSGKFDQGVLITNSDETITLPASSNFKLDEGTLETWIIPEWNGLDNDATLTFYLTKDGYVVDNTNIYIGSSSFNPEYDSNNKFTLNKNDILSPIGLPSTIYTSTGVFIYFDTDINQWKVLIRDLTDNESEYYGLITTTGEFYNSKIIPGLKELGDVFKTKSKSIEFTFKIDSQDALYPDGYQDGYSVTDGYYPLDGYVPGYSFDGIQFMSDEEHYIFDLGKEEFKNRISLFKDGAGFLVFKVYDRGDNKINSLRSYTVSHDISDWLAGEKHHVAISWKINSKNHRDEMHLFIDGFEVPNIMRYGGRPKSTLTDRFRTINPEYLLGTLPKNIITRNDLTITAGSAVVNASGTNFNSENINPGDEIEIKESGLGSFTILSVDGTELTLNSAPGITLQNARYTINPYSVSVNTQISLYKNVIVSLLRDGEEIELPGQRADLPGYEITQNLFNQDILTILGDAQAGDQLVIRSLGLNFKRIRESQYLWNSTNIIKTQLPPPINLDEVNVYALTLPKLAIGPNNATYSLGVFTATGIIPSTQPSNSTEGRTLSVKIIGGNTDFTTPVTVTINGTTSGPTSEMLIFSAAGEQLTTNKFKTITTIEVVAKPYVSTKNSAIIEIKEAYSLIYPDGNTIYPVLRFSYQTQQGSTLEGTSGSNQIIDENGYFIDSNVGQSLVISSPGSVAGTYTITNRVDTNTIEVSPVLPSSFNNGIYNIYNIALSRSGFQNGFFVFEIAGQTNQAYNLPAGYYYFDYATYLEIPFAPLSDENIYIGSDLLGNKQAKAVLDEFRILSTKLTDVRVGETLSSGTSSITTDFTKLRPFKKNSDTLVLLHFDSKPFINDADFWQAYTKEYFQSSSSVNSNFGKSLVINDKSLIIDNKGYLSTNSEGTIEFWVSPLFDTANDPNFRYYFDASAAVVEEVNSLSRASIKIAGRASRILSIHLASDKSNSGINYNAGATLASDFSTINLKKPLPYQKTPVKVAYIPRGTAGDRISIYKDSSNYINFYVKANNLEYEVRQPVFWEKDSWHRIKATFKFNRKDNLDEIRLFIDGEERGTVRFGQGLLFGSGLIFGQGLAGLDNSILTADINFSDAINQFSIGSDYLNGNPAFARFDNFRLSNLALPGINIAGQLKDVHYSANTESVTPAVGQDDFDPKESIQNLYTTYLLNFEQVFEKNTDFTIIHDQFYGIYNFTMNILDSFDIVLSDESIKNILESLILALRPAKSKVSINYLV